ncbi:unnamed protein product [Pleuronectes platessa]|uniref:Uncharacterized protein n=1 Tax=Pleuronectes platessa TaxID=8262 RepID=A0A9N7YNG6_PLEPL|nr:unnamed protein product [Pleuronectes platessa]
MTYKQVECLLNVMYGGIPCSQKGNMVLAWREESKGWWRKCTACRRVEVCATRTVWSRRACRERAQWQRTPTRPLPPSVAHQPPWGERRASRERFENKKCVDLHV